MIGAVEVWVKRADGRESVIRIADDVTVRELPAVPFGSQDQDAPPGAPGSPLTDAAHERALDLLAELRDDVAAFETRGQPKMRDYAEALASRLAAILDRSDSA